MIIFLLLFACGIGRRGGGDQAECGRGQQEHACHGVILAVSRDGNAFAAQTLRLPPYSTDASNAPAKEAFTRVVAAMRVGARSRRHGFAI
jgi:hypothetical protein